MKSVRTTIALAIAGLAAAWLPLDSALAQEKMRISLETNATHVRNRGAEMFVTELKKRIGNKLTVEIYPSSQLFRDRDIPKALRQNAVEMGIPGTWQLDGVEPNAAMQTLPMFYGVGPDTVYPIIDGKLGQFLNKRMEDKLKVKILGKWMDLGFQHFYGVSKPVAKYDDLKGLKFRFPGGSANAARVKAFGGLPTLIPWAEVPLAMSQGVIDGLLTTHESVRSAKLWDSGMRSSFEDFQYFAQYVPMVSLNFWNKQPKDVQNAILAAWDAIVGEERKMAAAAQIEARAIMIQNGIKVTTPSRAEIVAARKRLMTLQADLVKEMKIDADAVEVALDALRAAKVEF